MWDTSDDVLEVMNSEPLNISSDISTTSTDTTNPNDRVRGYFSYHPGGANFVLGDGSVQFIRETINATTYRHLSSMKGGEVVGQY